MEWLHKEGRQSRQECLYWSTVKRYISEEEDWETCTREYKCQETFYQTNFQIGFWNLHFVCGMYNGNWPSGQWELFTQEIAEGLVRASMSPDKVSNMTLGVESQRPISLTIRNLMSLAIQKISYVTWAIIIIIIPPPPFSIFFTTLLWNYWKSVCKITLLWKVEMKIIWPLSNIKYNLPGGFIRYGY